MLQRSCRVAGGRPAFAPAAPHIVQHQHQPHQGRRAARRSTSTSSSSSVGTTSRVVAVRAAASTASTAPTAAACPGRRDALAQLAGLAAALACAGPTPSAAAKQAVQAPEVSTYLPAAPQGDGLVTFIPDPKKTPALRAGTVDPSNPYRFALPGTFRESRVPNILSGNYCAPRCDEPWTEVVFESASEGKIFVIVTPLIKLTRQKGAAIQDIGTPDGLLVSLGSYITGTYLDEDDVESATSTKQEDGRTYYYYSINAPYGTNGPHTYSACTTKGDLALLFVASASDKQWAAAKDRLVKSAESFRA